MPTWPVKLTVGRQNDSACGTCSSVARNDARCASKLRIVVVGFGEGLGQRLRPQRRCHGDDQQRGRDRRATGRQCLPGLVSRSDYAPLMAFAPAPDVGYLSQNTKPGFGSKPGSSGVAASNITRRASTPPVRVVKVARPTPLSA